MPGVNRGCQGHEGTWLQSPQADLNQSSSALYFTYWVSACFHCFSKPILKTFSMKPEFLCLTSWFLHMNKVSIQKISHTERKHNNLTSNQWVTAIIGIKVGSPFYCFGGPQRMRMRMLAEEGTRAPRSTNQIHEARDKRFSCFPEEKQNKTNKKAGGIWPVTMDLGLNPGLDTSALQGLAGDQASTSCKLLCYTMGFQMKTACSHSGKQKGLQWNTEVSHARAAAWEGWKRVCEHTSLLSTNIHPSKPGMPPEGHGDRIHHRAGCRNGVYSN